MSIESKMAWRNVWRNPRRTGLTISAIAFACLLLVFMLSWQFGSYESLINASVKINTGHLQIQHPKYDQKKVIRYVVPGPESIGKKLEKMEGVEAYTYRSEGFSLVASEDRTYGALVVGIDPVKEGRVSTLKSLIRKGEYLSETDQDAALVGRLLAKNLRVDIGDEITLMGQGRDGSVAAAIVRVKGIYASGIDEFDRNAIQMPLSYFQEVFFMRDGVHRIVVNAKSLDDVASIRDELTTDTLAADLAVLDWIDLSPGLVQSIYLDLISGLIFYLILVIVVAFSIMNTFFMAIFERTREFGVLMAMGTTPGRLVKLLLLESGFMTLTGVLTGMLFGTIITLIIQHYGIDMSGSSGELMAQYGISGKLYPKLSLTSLLTGPAAVLIITFLVALYPAFRVKKLKPVEALVFL